MKIKCVAQAALSSRVVSLIAILSVGWMGGPAVADPAAAGPSA